MRDFFTPMMLFVLGILACGCLALLAGNFLMGIVFLVCGVILGAFT